RVASLLVIATDVEGNVGYQQQQGYHRQYHQPHRSTLGRRGLCGEVLRRSHPRLLPLRELAPATANPRLPPSARKQPPQAYWPSVAIGSYFIVVLSICCVDMPYFRKLATRVNIRRVESVVAGRLKGLPPACYLGAILPATGP